MPELGTDVDKIAKSLLEMDKEMDSYKEQYISKGWDSIPDFYRGETHWNKDRPSHKVSPVLNFLRQAIEKKTSQMTDTKPFMDILPFYDPLTRVAEALEDIIASKWSEQSLDMALTDGIFFSELFGGVGFNTTFNKELLFGKGDSTFEIIDPRNLNFDPACTAAHYVDRCEYVRTQVIKPTSLLKFTYQDFAEQIQDDAPYDFYVPEKKILDRKGRAIRKVVNRVQNKKGAIGRSIVREYWIQDRELEGKKLKYKGGRHIIIAGGVIVKDEANPYWDKKFPIDFLDWHKNPDSAWGDSELKDLKELQIVLNKLIAVVVENGIMMSNAIWIGDSNALKPDEWKGLDNIPGLKVKIKPGSTLRREVGQPVPTTVFNTITYLEQAIDKLSGNVEVVKGQTPGQVKSGIAIEALQQAAMAIVRLKARAIESLLERIGQKFISRIFQFESGDRQMWRLKSDKDFEAFKFMGKVLRGETKESKKFLKNKEDAYKNFLFKIRPGSSLQMNKWQDAMIALQLYQAQPQGLIDREYALDLIDLPNRAEVVQRMEKKEAAQMQLQMKMAEQKEKMDIIAAGRGGGSAPKPADPASPHAQQGQQEKITKNSGA